jgi:predicted permease
MGVMEWFTRRRRDDDLQDEIRAHLAMAAADRVRDGEDPEAARLAALKEFGNVTLTRERTRLTWAGAWRLWLFDLVQDVRYSLRLLSRTPGYALVVLIVLALGIGANILVFRLFRPLALEPIPGVRDSARLGVLATRTTGNILPLSHPDFRDLVSTQNAFEGITGTSLESFTLALGTKGERIWAEEVTGNYFEVLGVRAQLGRTLLPSDDITPGGHPVVVLSDGVWKRSFGADPAIVGRTVRVSGYPLTVVGVTEPAFHGSVVGMDVEAFVPIMMQAQTQGRDDLSRRDAAKLWGLGRLKPGISIDDAAAQAAVLFARLRTLQPDDDVSQRATVMPMWRSPFGAQTYMLPAVGLLSAMGVLLLLIVCANVSNLVLVRGLGRRGEIAARLALGASRARVLRLLVIESLSLAIPGAVAGLLTSGALLQLMNGAGATTTSGPGGRMFIDGSVNGLVVFFALALSCGCALVFGLLPAFRISRVDLASIMRDDLSPRTASSSHMRNLLVVSQVAVSLVLLVGAVLVLRSLASARHADPGFDTRNVVSISLDLQAGGYDNTRGQAFFANVLDALRGDAGVESATLAAVTPMGLVPSRQADFEIEGYVRRTGEDLRFLINPIAPDYFDTLRIPLIAGRDFNRSDDRESRRVVIVNETLARRFWNAPENAIGKRLRTVPRGEWALVAGVVRDVKYLRLDEAPRPYVYLPSRQLPLMGMFAHVRWRGDAHTAIPQLRARIQAMDANLPILYAAPLSEQTQAGFSILQVAASMLAMLGGVAALLAALGTYGMVSYSARQSEHEIGIRIAVGANRADVVRRFLGRGLRLGAAGAAIGVIGALAISRSLVSLLYGVSATDPVSFSFASATVIVVVCLASLLPAWRAARTDPIAALRHR